MMGRIAFPLLLVLVAGCSLFENASAPMDSGVEGQVFVGPACPVVQQGQECPDRPYQAVITVKSPSGARVVQFQTDENGEFHVPLAPGEYILQPESRDGITLANELTFSVLAGRFTRLIVTYDSGIR